VIVSILSSGTLTLQGLELTDGNGGGISSNGSLVLDSVLVTGNSATGSAGSAGGVGESAEYGIGVGLLHTQTITKWLWFVKNNATQLAPLTPHLQ